MKKNGQALVEFIIILPILIIILMSIIDFGIIFYEKNTLENNLDEVVDIWKNEKTNENIKKYLEKVNNEIEFEITIDNKTTTIKLIDNYNPITPGLNKILKSPYEIKVSRVIYNE